MGIESSKTSFKYFPLLFNELAHESNFMGVQTDSKEKFPLTHCGRDRGAIEGFDGNHSIIFGPMGCLNVGWIQSGRASYHLLLS